MIDTLYKVLFDCRRCGKTIEMSHTETIKQVKDIIEPFLEKFGSLELVVCLECQRKLEAIIKKEIKK